MASLGEREIFGIFDIFANFCPKNRVLLPVRRATWRALMIGTYSGGKLDIFGFFMKIYACSGMAGRFHQLLGCLKGQKHSKNDLTAPILKHRKQCWEDGFLEGQMEAKLTNSTWVKK